MACHHRQPGFLGRGSASVFLWLLAAGLGLGPGAGSIARADSTGLSYTNQRVASVPWSVHVVRVDRTNQTLELRSVHAQHAAVGLSPLTTQILPWPDGDATPVAAVNGDFYQRDRTFAGDPRGLQIVDGELISAPSGGVAFWVDAQGEPRTGEVASKLEVVWPDRRRTPIGLNADRLPDAAVLYTEAVGKSTQVTGGREYVLEGIPGKPWLPLPPGVERVGRVRAVNETGNSPIAPGTVVLSLGTTLAKSLPKLVVGAEVILSTATVPSLTGVRTAIGGGPVLVRGGRKQKIVVASDSYEATSMIERHPRSAVGWNAQSVFLVEVDGRQKDLSAGMTLDELAAWLVKLGCLEAMNLDGGGSATLWYDGKVRNSPCDGRERPIANALAVVRKTRAPIPAAGAKP